MNKMAPSNFYYYSEYAYYKRDQMPAMN